MYCIFLEFKIVLEFVFALVSDHLPPNSPNIIIELKPKKLIFVNTLCLTKGRFKKIAFGSFVIRSSACPHPAHDPASNLAVNAVLSGGLRGRLCGVSHAPHVRDFIPLSHGKKK